MTKWICSDLHINHRQIVKYCPIRVSPKFLGDVNVATDEEIDYLISEMNEKIISNWNSLVLPGDDVYILGDVAMGKIVNAPPLIRRLNGKKYLVSGNHDVSLKKLINNNPELDNLFIWVKDYHEMTHQFEDKKYMLRMSHFPFRHWSHQNQGSMMIHGHLHGSPCDVPGRIIDVGIDTNNLYPYLLDTVVERLSHISSFEEHHKD